MTTFPKAPLIRFTDEVPGKDIPGPGTYDINTSSSTARMTSFSKLHGTFASDETVYFTPEPASGKTKPKSKAGFKVPLLQGLKFSADKRKTLVHAKSTETVAAQHDPELLAHNGELKEALAAAEAASKALAEEKHSLINALDGLTTENVDLLKEIDLLKSDVHESKERIIQLEISEAGERSKAEFANLSTVQLKDAVEAKDERIYVLEAKVNDLLKAKTEADGRLERLNTENEKLQQSVELLEDDQRSLEIVRDKLGRELSEVKDKSASQNKQLEEALAAVEGACKVLVDEKQSLTDALEGLTTENADLLKEIDLLKSTVHESHERILQLEISEEGERSKAEFANLSTTQLKEEVGAKDKQIYVLEAKVNDLLKAKTEADERLERLNTENEKLQQSVELLEGDQKSFEIVIDKLGQEVRELEDKSAYQNEELKVTTQKLKASATEIAVLGERLEELRSDKQELLRELREKDGELEKSNATVETLRQDVGRADILRGDLEMRNEALSANMEKLESQLNGHADRCEVDDNEKQRLNDEITRLKSELALLRVDTSRQQADMDDENVGLREQLKNAEQQRSALQQEIRELEEQGEHVETAMQIQFEESIAQFKFTETAQLAHQNNLERENEALRDAIKVAHTRSDETMKEMAKLNILFRDAERSMSEKTVAVVGEIDRIMFYCDGLEKLVAELKSKKDLKVQMEIETKKENDLKVQMENDTKANNDLKIQRENEVKKEKDALIKVLIPLNDQSKGLTKEMEKLMGKLNKTEERKSSVQAEHRRLQQESQQLNYQLKASQESKSAVKAQEAKLLSDQQSAVESRSELHTFLTSQKTGIEKLVNVRKKGQSFHDSIWLAAEQYGREIGHKNPNQSLRQSQHYAVENVKLKEENGCLKAANDHMQKELKTLKR